MNNVHDAISFRVSSRAIYGRPGINCVSAGARGVAFAAVNSLDFLKTATATATVAMRISVRVESRAANLRVYEDRKGANCRAARLAGL